MVIYKTQSPTSFGVDIRHAVVHCAPSWQSVFIDVSGHVVETGRRLPGELKNMVAGEFQLKLASFYSYIRLDQKQHMLVNDPYAEVCVVKPNMVYLQNQ